MEIPITGHLEKILQYLTSVYDKTAEKYRIKQASVFAVPRDLGDKFKNSNIVKLMSIVGSEFDEIKNMLVKVKSWRDIDQAEGVTLDRIGNDVDQLRGRANDNVYRVLIKAAIAQNVSRGNINDIIRILAVSLGTSESEIQVVERWHGITGEPAAIEVSVPLDAVGPTGLSQRQLRSFIKKVTAGGVAAYIGFEGTFAFSDHPTQKETGSPFGFDNGTLGAYFDPGDDLDIPV